MPQLSRHVWSVPVLSLTVGIGLALWAWQVQGGWAALATGLVGLSVGSIWWALGAERRARRSEGNHADLECQLQEAQRLAALGRLSGGVAHDFNNLLTVIIGNTELILESLEARSPLRQPAELMLHAGERGRVLTQRLLSFARHERHQPQRVDINSLLVTCREILEASLDGRVSVEMQLARDLLPARVDPAQLEATIVNLAINARDAMPDGGRLRIATSNALIHDEGLARAPQLRPGRYVRITVSDTGQGISDDLQRQVFKPFFTTKGQGKGTGLGLSMAYAFIRQSGGHIALFSEPRAGTRVHLYLPSAEARPRQPVQPSPQHQIHQTASQPSR